MYTLLFWLHDICKLKISEYGMGSAVTTEGDVYSFGILLLELFTGKRPTDELFRDGMNLHNFVNMALEDHVMVIVDQSAWYREEGLCKEKDDTGSSLTHGQTKNIISIFRIGIACSEESPTQRMNMGQVAVHLNTIKEEFVSSQTML